MSPDKGLTRKKATLSLFILSFISLFLELFLIRFNPACVKVIGYYTNLVLIACFLGLGIGLSSSQKESSFWSSFPFWFLILNLVLAILVLIGQMPAYENWGETIWDFGFGLFPSFWAPLVIFCLNVIIMIPIGRELGRVFNLFHPLSAYSLNLTGSLAGVIIFTLINFLFPHPMVFGMIIIILYLSVQILLQCSTKRLVSTLICFVFAFVIIFWLKGDSLWSPYYKITISPELSYKLLHKKIIFFKLPDGFVLKVNDDLHQYALNLSDEYLESLKQTEPLLSKYLFNLSRYFDFPYKWNHPQKVLILGSGTGNDVASAVRSPAIQIDAIEIDPLIAKIGKEKHPEKPYSKPGVRLFINDARNFLKNSKEKYDLIVYGFLDSHTLFSSLSSLRLDNFVYTLEGFEEAKKHLSPNGLVVVMFHASKEFVAKRLFWMMETVFPGKTRAVYFKSRTEDMESFQVIVAGNNIEKIGLDKDGEILDSTPKFLENKPEILPTDNWPFLYLEKNKIFSGYFLTIIALFLVSILFLKISLPGFASLKLPFFFLGAGFLLLETKSITQLSLLFGSTWIVNSIVIIWFLVMAILSALASFRVKANYILHFYIFLFLSLALNYFFPFNRLLGFPFSVQILVGGVVVSLPVFFSGFIFALLFRETKAQAQALGSNLLGSVLGGLSEYFSLLFGFQMLFMLAGLYYLCSVIFQRNK